MALVQSGTIGNSAGGLESLGTLFYEPLWIFHRGGLEGATLAALRLDRTGGQRLSCAPSPSAQA